MIYDHDWRNKQILFHVFIRNVPKSSENVAIVMLQNVSQMWTNLYTGTAYKFGLGIGVTRLQNQD